VTRLTLHGYEPSGQHRKDGQDQHTVQRLPEVVFSQAGIRNCRRQRCFGRLYWKIRKRTPASGRSWPIDPRC